MKPEDKILNDYANKHGHENWIDFKYKSSPYTIISVDLPNIIKGLHAELEEETRCKDAYLKQGVERAMEITKLRSAMQKFVDRVDRGEVRSVKTYSEFKKLLEIK